MSEEAKSLSLEQAAKKLGGTVPDSKSVEQSLQLAHTSLDSAALFTLFQDSQAPTKVIAWYEPRGRLGAIYYSTDLVDQDASTGKPSIPAHEIQSIQLGNAHPIFAGKASANSFVLSTVNGDYGFQAVSADAMKTWVTCLAIIAACVPVPAVKSLAAGHAFKRYQNTDAGVVANDVFIFYEADDNMGFLYISEPGQRQKTTPFDVSKITDVFSGKKVSTSPSVWESPVGSAAATEGCMTFGFGDEMLHLEVVPPADLVEKKAKTAKLKEVRSQWIRGLQALFKFCTVDATKPNPRPRLAAPPAEPEPEPEAKPEAEAVVAPEDVAVSVPAEEPVDVPSPSSVPTPAPVPVEAEPVPAQVPVSPVAAPAAAPVEPETKPASPVAAVEVQPVKPVEEVKAVEQPKPVEPVVPVVADKPVEQPKAQPELVTPTYANCMQRGDVFWRYFDDSRTQIFLFHEADETNPLGAFYWCEPGKREKSDERKMPLKSITDVYMGKQQSVFQTPVAADAMPSCCFSFKSRAAVLHLEASSPAVREEWKVELTNAFKRPQPKKVEQLEPAEDPAVVKLKQGYNFIRHFAADPHTFEVTVWYNGDAFFCSPRGTRSQDESLPLKSITDVYMGKHSQLFKSESRQALPAEVCLSLGSKQQAKQQSWDLQASSKEERDAFVRGLKLLYSKKTIKPAKPADKAAEPEAKKPVEAAETSAPAVHPALVGASADVQALNGDARLVCLLDGIPMTLIDAAGAHDVSIFWDADNGQTKNGTLYWCPVGQRVKRPEQSFPFRGITDIHASKAKIQNKSVLSDDRKGLSLVAPKAQLDLEATVEARKQFLTAIGLLLKAHRRNVQDAKSPRSPSSTKADVLRRGVDLTWYTATDASQGITLFYEPEDATLYWSAPGSRQKLAARSIPIRSISDLIVGQHESIKTNDSARTFVILANKQPMVLMTPSRQDRDLVIAALHDLLVASGKKVQEERPAPSAADIKLNLLVKGLNFTRFTAAGQPGTPVTVNYMPLRQYLPRDQDLTNAAPLLTQRVFVKYDARVGQNGALFWTFAGLGSLRIRSATQQVEEVDLRYVSDIFLGKECKLKSGSLKNFPEDLEFRRCFTMVTKKGAVLSLAAEDEASRDAWLGAVKHLFQSAGKKVHSKDASGSPRGSSSPISSGVEFEAYWPAASPPDLLSEIHYIPLNRISDIALGKKSPHSSIFQHPAFDNVDRHLCMSLYSTNNTSLHLVAKNPKQRDAFAMGLHERLDANGKRFVARRLSVTNAPKQTFSTAAMRDGFSCEVFTSNPKQRRQAKVFYHTPVPDQVGLICWCAPNTTTYDNALPLKDVSDIFIGPQMPVLKEFAKEIDPTSCCSVVTKDGQALHVQFANSIQMQTWMKSLTFLKSGQPLDGDEGVAVDVVPYTAEQMREGRSFTSYTLLNAGAADEGAAIMNVQHVFVMFCPNGLGDDKEPALYWTPIGEQPSSARRLLLDNVQDLYLDKQTPTFRHPAAQNARPNCCCSVVCEDGTGLHLEAATQTIRDSWLHGFREVLLAHGKKVDSKGDRDELDDELHLPTAADLMRQMEEGPRAVLSLNKADQMKFLADGCDVYVAGKQGRVFCTPSTLYIDSDQKSEIALNNITSVIVAGNNLTLVANGEYNVEFKSDIVFATFLVALNLAFSALQREAVLEEDGAKRVFSMEVNPERPTALLCQGLAASIQYIEKPANYKLNEDGKVVPVVVRYDTDAPLLHYTSDVANFSGQLHLGDVIEVKVNHLTVSLVAVSMTLVLEAGFAAQLGTFLLGLSRALNTVGKQVLANEDHSVFTVTSPRFIFPPRQGPIKGRYFLQQPVTLVPVPASLPAVVALTASPKTMTWIEPEDFCEPISMRFESTGTECMLSWFTTANPSDTGVLYLSDVNCITVGQSTNVQFAPCTVAFHTYDNTYQFAASSPAERDEWLAQLNEVFIASGVQFQRDDPLTTFLNQSKASSSVQDIVDPATIPSSQQPLNALLEKGATFTLDGKQVFVFLRNGGLYWVASNEPVEAVLDRCLPVNEISRVTLGHNSLSVVGNKTIDLVSDKSELVISWAFAVQSLINQTPKLRDESKSA